MLVDGLDIVLDLTRSGGSYLVDAITGRRYLDMFTFVASSALGMNPPALVDDREFHAELMQAALNKPSNSDVYSVAMARFVETFARVLGDPALPHLFFVEGGALAVENALKAAFDWKSRHNQAHGIDPALGTQVLHLRGAFHGRSGYTLSLTNTKPTITARFPKFDWPRIDAPYMRPGLDEPAMAALEAEALRQARAAFETRPHDIACFVAEPIQGEGGDRHFRPEFFAAMRELCDEFDALLIFDEVQTGCGLTGTAWAYQQLDVAPDIVAFGKKTQVCGVMAGRRVDEVADNVFAVPSRLNSTWGGNLTDMVRARRILEVIEAEGLFERAVQQSEAGAPRGTIGEGPLEPRTWRAVEVERWVAGAITPFQVGKRPPVGQHEHIRLVGANALGQRWRWPGQEHTSDGMPIRVDSARVPCTSPRGTDSA